MTDIVNRVMIVKDLIDKLVEGCVYDGPSARVVEGYVIIYAI